MHPKNVPIPQELCGCSYLSLTTFRKNGIPVPTPVWFGEDNGKIYVSIRSDSGKYKRLRNNSRVQIALCNVRGKILGPEHPAVARILPETDWPGARQVIRRKYWLARLPIWSKLTVYLEITPEA